MNRSPINLGFTIRVLSTLLLATSLVALHAQSATARDVVAFWGFAKDYDFDPNDDAPLNKLDFPGDVDHTVSDNANLQAYLGKAEELDQNGGNGFVSYTSPTSGITYDETRTVKWDDLKGGGDDFDIGGVTEFQIDKLDGNGPEPDNFSNDALMYFTFDGTGFADFQLRFDIEATPFDPDDTDVPPKSTLPDSFDIFYRTGGSGTWFRDPAQNNIGLNFMDYPTPDPENQFADSGPISLAAALNGQSQIEVIVSDFAENGNLEMEIDNIEITASAVPEPTSLVLLSLSACALLTCRRLRAAAS